jgi:hypothetical protein
VKRLEVHVPDDYWEALTSIANKEKIFISTVIVHAIEELWNAETGEWLNPIRKGG